MMVLGGVGNIPEFPQVRKALEVDVTKLTKEDRIKHELFLCYSTNTLYYLYLKINGVNVNEVSGQIYFPEAIES